jgi:putative ABC transport system permease protein
MSAATVAPRAAAPRSARWRHARRGLTGEAGPGPAWTLAAVSLLSVFIGVAGPREVTAVQYSAQRSALARVPALELGVAAQATWLENEAASNVLSPSAGQDLARRLAADVRPIPLAAAGQWASVSSPAQTVTNPAPRAVIYAPPTMVVTYRSGLPGFARVVTGKLPDVVTRVPPRPGEPHGALLLDAAVTTATASRFELHPGSQVRLGSYLPARPELVLRVTAVVAGRQPGSPFWQYDPNLIKPIVPQPSVLRPWWQGMAIVGRPELAALQSAFGGGIIHGVWFAPMSRGGLDRAVLSGVAGHLRELITTNGGTALQAPLPGLAGSGGTSTTMTIATGFPAAIGPFVAQQRTAVALDALLIADVLLAGLLVVITCARLVAGAYRPELALIRARGGSARQVAGRVLARSACLAGPGVVAGAAAGFACTPAPPNGGSGTAWLLGGLAAAAAIGIPALAALWTHRGVRPAGADRTDLATVRPSRRRLVAELTVLVIAGAALTAARLRGSGSGSDALTWVAPVLAAAAAALIAARLYPVPVRGLLRLAAARPGAVGFLALARAARARIGALLPALTLVISLTLAVFGVMIVGSVRAGQDAASWRQTGADVTVQTIQNNSVPGALTREVAAVPGVRHVAAVYASRGGSQLLGVSLLASGRAAQRRLGVVVVPPAAYAALAGDTPWPGFPAAALARGPHVPGEAGAIPVVVSAGLGTVGERATLLIGGNRLPVRIGGTSGPTPAMTTGRFVVLPAWAAARLPYGQQPEMLLATGTGISLPALRAAARRELPHAQIRSREQIIAALRNQPAPQAAARLYYLGTGVAALLSVIALLFGLAVSGRDRGRLVDRLMALGIGSGQARAVAVSEVLPLLAVAVLGTAIAGLVLAMVLGPALNLAVFTGAPGPVRVQPGLITALPAAGIVVLGLVIVAAQSAAFLRRNIAAGLRHEETG